MTAAGDNDSQRRISHRPGVGIAADIRQRCELLLTRVRVDFPSIIHVQAGAKTLRNDAGDTLTIPAGQAVAIAGGQSLDVTNISGPDGVYTAACLACAPELAARFRPANADAGGDTDGNGGAVINDMLALRQMPDGFLAALAHARRAVVDDSVPQSVAVHRLEEALLWLETLGGRFLPPGVVSTATRLRGLIAAEPGADWTAPIAARRLAMSEATLRRRLAADGQSLSAILTDVRMGQALSLLQMTDRPVGAIAADMGYDCPSRFAARFRQRFGFAPSAIRGRGN